MCAWPPTARTPPTPPFIFFFIKSEKYSSSVKHDPPRHNVPETSVRWQRSAFRHPPGPPHHNGSSCRAKATDRRVFHCQHCVEVEKVDHTRFIFHTTHSAHTAHTAGTFGWLSVGRCTKRVETTPDCPPTNGATVKATIEAPNVARAPPPPPTTTTTGFGFSPFPPSLATVRVCMDVSCPPKISCWKKYSRRSKKQKFCWSESFFFLKILDGSLTPGRVLSFFLGVNTTFLRAPLRIWENLSFHDGCGLKTARVFFFYPRIDWLIDWLID